MTTTVDDLMSFLNSKLGLKIPLLPLTGFPAFVMNLWKRAVLNWSPADGVPSSVSIELTPPLTITMGGGDVTATAASILVRTGSPSSPSLGFS